ncbi:cobalt-precorrin-5B (C(1))-methyltransferase [Geobacter hydrogenophilus]|uniref:Cobalt-precorrin-5B C(1)-methyltransferase n=1 Tax=Geobacter hydrogenophilus TaxID=40983 RepID=A0A9W6LC32_9BACT|nr:cobalt-precorrin-5B (C(1))-methyltransferase [Geobacter hydrogenophilus]MBT0894200.1 cobalt-precorrin-5B (C(1))-methyltransferase [Geobacter hydrogenophilus]GLI38517.1 cobalt-precorrin-5B C(1)-methyltransferase [Geobacter hydrogenophilus]
MGEPKLRHGYTTGACAAAAAKGAARMLREQCIVEEVELVLPRGERVAFRLQGQEFDDSAASCFVVKDAGDDPDVTNGAEIHARVRREPLNRSGARTMIFVDGGKGVGTVTKPGLGVGVGNPAINPVPMRMITEGVKEEFSVICLPQVLHVTISIPNGEELAKKTLNARLGIAGGLSILGTTGIVRPISAKAWTDTLDAALDVARACGCETVVLSTGRTSELVAQKAKALPEEAYVMMGDHVGYALRACARKGVRHVVLAGQFAKLLKIACGHEQTHVSSSELDLQMLAEWLQKSGSRSPVPGPWSRYNTARQVLEESGHDRAIMELVCLRAREAAQRLAPSLDIKVLLAGYDSTVLYFG